MARSDLPFGSEFTPQTVDLPFLLELAKQHGPDWHAFEDAVRERYFNNPTTSEAQRRKRATNTKLSLRAYGLIRADDTTLTQIGNDLYGLRHDEDKLYEAFARHILRERMGASFVQCILEMQAAGEKITLVELRRGLSERGVLVPSAGKHMSTLRLWLERAGIFESDYRVNHERFEGILGIATTQFAALATLTREQRDYLDALANVDSNVSHLSNEIARLAEATSGTNFNEKSLARQVLYPLRDAGYIQVQMRTKGRGAKAPLVTGTEKLETHVVRPLLRQLEQQVRPELRPLLRKPLKEIREEITSPDAQLRGLALEALAFKLMRSVGLRWVGTRVRGKDTGGAEVDLVFDSDRLVFSRWQIQCKNTKRVKLDDVAKEVGLAHTLKSNAVAIVTTGKIGTGAREYATQVMQTLNLCIIFIEGSDLNRIEKRPAAILDVLTREARHAMDLKKLDL